MTSLAALYYAFTRVTSFILMKGKRGLTGRSDLTFFFFSLSGHFASIRIFAFVRWPLCVQLYLLQSFNQNLEKLVGMFLTRRHIPPLPTYNIVHMFHSTLMNWQSLLQPTFKLQCVCLIMFLLQML